MPRTHLISVRCLRALVLSCITLLTPVTAYSIAFCDLRDPTHQIFDLYPTATSYRSLVEVVDTTVKADIGKQLPFTLHNRELGKHTLYLALDEEQTLGLVHVRSEASDWGLIEIVWSMGLDLRIRDFKFQRCREAGCKAVEDDQFKLLLQGKNLQELREQVGENGEQLTTADLQVADKNRNLAAAVVRSALKTLLVTEIVWGQQIAEIG